MSESDDSIDFDHDGVSEDDAGSPHHGNPGMRSARSMNKRYREEEESDDEDSPESHSEDRHVTFGEDSSIPVARFTSHDDENSENEHEDSAAKDSEGEEKDDWLTSLKDAASRLPVDNENAQKAIAARSAFFDDDTPIDKSKERSYDRILSIIRMLDRGESARMAMDRFLGRRKQEKPKGQFRSTIKARRKDVAISSGESERDMDSFNKLTELVDYVGSIGGWVDILDNTREEIRERMLRIPFEFRIVHEGHPSDRQGPVNLDHLDRVSQTLPRGAVLEFKQGRTAHEWGPFILG